MMSLKKCWPDRFSRFDVFWIRTPKHTPKQTSKLYIYINVDLYQQKKECQKGRIFTKF